MNGLNFMHMPTAPLRRYLLGWQKSYGDDVATMALGFGIDPGLLAKVLGRRPASRLRVDEARLLCVRLRAHPEEIWPSPEATRVGAVEWETEPFWPDAGVDPIALERVAL